MSLKNFYLKIHSRLPYKKHVKFKWLLKVGFICPDSEYEYFMRGYHRCSKYLTISECQELADIIYEKYNATIDSCDCSDCE